MIEAEALMAGWRAAHVYFLLLGLKPPITIYLQNWTCKNRKIGIVKIAKLDLYKSQN